MNELMGLLKGKQIPFNRIGGGVNVDFGRAFIVVTDNGNNLDALVNTYFPESNQVFKEGISVTEAMATIQAIGLEAGDFIASLSVQPIGA